jgi:hypothetical protein
LLDKAGDLALQGLEPVFLGLETGSDGDDENAVTRSSESRPPADGEIAALRRVIEDVLARCP